MRNTPSRSGEIQLAVFEKYFFREWGCGDESVMAGPGEGKWLELDRADFWAVCDPPARWVGAGDKTGGWEMRSGVRALHLACSIHYPHTPLILAEFHWIAQPSGS